jgi:DNA-binding SARP family transcriptional activator
MEQYAGRLADHSPQKVHKQWITSLNMSDRHYAEAHPLTFHLLGTPQIRWQNIPLKISRRQARSLLYRLATDMLPISRDQLAFLFWPDSPDATGRRNLNRLLSYVRKQMPDPDCLILNYHSLQLNPKLVWSDAQALIDMSDDAELEMLTTGI